MTSLVDYYEFRDVETQYLHDRSAEPNALQMSPAHVHSWVTWYRDSATSRVAVMWQLFRPVAAEMIWLRGIHFLSIS